MFQKLLSVSVFLFAALLVRAQVTCDPFFPTVDDNVTIYYNATEGNGALAGVSPVYAHMGVITTQSTSPSDWKHVVTTWGIADPVGAMQLESPNVWKKSFNIRQFFNIQPTETVLKLAFVFRNTNGNVVGRAANGGDIFYDVYPANGPLQTIFVKPSSASVLASLGGVLPVKAAASKSGALALYDNGAQIATGNGLSLETNINTTVPGLHLVQFTAQSGSEKDTTSFLYLLPQTLPAQDPPAGTQAGIQYLDDQSVRLSLYAPNKQVVHVIGDFNDWLPTTNYQMRRSLDGTTWWIDITGLTPGEPYRFQYLVDGALRIADPLSTLVLDPWNDPFIPPLTYPNLLPYPTDKTSGFVSVLQTAQPAFNWEANDYQRPKKTDLVIYELLVRDFIARHDYQTLTDTLDYLERLGVTAIELMPVSEFDGNISWGYNPAFHKSLDKYYGTAEALKTFVDECHKRNIAVILDVVFNQVTGASPLAQLYWDNANNRPAADNPWLNPIAKHDFNVFNDFNHESLATKSYVKNCIEYWLEEFRFDGFRYDLSKGFTQKNTLGNSAAMAQYDAGRVAIWKDYADFQWSVDNSSYVILEHFADNIEEKELAEYGMMLWGNMWGAYKDVGLGFSSGVNNASLTGISYKQRGWSVPHLIGYMESHDEDRIGYELKTFGNNAPGYNVRSLPIAMRRMEMLHNLLLTVPGPKMLWQFGEVGYDFHINLCENGSVSNSCRTSPKPIRWDYYQDPYRRRLYDVTAALLHLRKNYDVFETTDFNASIGGGKIRQVYLNAPDMAVYLIANVNTTAENTFLFFTSTGAWYEYYTGDSLQATNGVPVPVTLQPGEYRLYLNKYVPLPDGLNPTPTRAPAGPFEGLAVYPNPASAFIMVDFSLSDRSEVQIEVLDLAGRVVYRELPGELPAGEQSFQVSTHNWAPGFYWLRVRDARGAGMVRKVVKGG